MTEELDLYLNALGVPVMARGRDGCIRFVNTAFEEMTGLPGETVVGHAVWDVPALTEIADAEKAAFEAALAAGSPGQHTANWPSGLGQHSVQWVHRRLDAGEDGPMLLSTAFSSVPIEKALKDHERQLAAVFASATDSIIVSDEFGVIKEANPATERIFGYKPEELTGRNVSMLMPEPFRSQHDGHLERYRATGVKRVIGIGREVIGLRKNGEVFPHYLSLSEVRLEDRSLFTAIIKDLSEEKKNQAKLVQAQKAEAIGKLSGGIAHDFNNLLTIILGNLEILECHVTGPGNEILQEMTEVVEHGSSLVAQLLAFGRRQALSPEVVNLNNLVTRLVGLLNRTLKESITIEERLDRSLSTVHADIAQLENVLINLIINARDAMPDGGTITISTANETCRSHRPCPVPGMPPGRYVRLSVTDTGTGMPPEVLEKACDPFFTTKRPGAGTGLGLSTVHGVVSQSGGYLQLESTVGKGTRISIYLPAHDDRSVTDKPAEDGLADEAHGNGETILHVEDDPKVRQINTRRLLSLGYHVLTAKNGPSALEMLANHNHVDLLFTDVVMPGGMSGAELADRACAERPGLAVLLTTGYSDEILASGTRPYRLLRKPYKTDMLARCIRDALDARPAAPAPGPSGTPSAS